MSLASSALQADSLTLCHLGSPYYVDLYLKKNTHKKHAGVQSEALGSNPDSASNGEANGASGLGVGNATPFPGFGVPIHAGCSITSGFCRVGEVAG